MGVEYNKKYENHASVEFSTKKSLVSIVWIILFLLLPAAGHAVIAKNLQPTEAMQLVDQKTDLFLLDVRTPGEYLQARLDGAYLIPIDQLTRRLNEIPRNRPVMVYCAVGSRSMQVVNYLVRNGYPEVYNMYGGIYAWAMKGYPYLQGPP